MLWWELLEQRMNRIEACSPTNFENLERRLEDMAKTIKDLQEDVTKQTTVIQSAATLLSGLAQQLRDAIAANDPAALTALADQIESNTAALSQSVTDNTPSAPGT